MSSAEILIAENEASVAQELKARVEGLGYRVVDIAYSGEEVIQKTERLRPRLVLMNTRLKGSIDGLQTGGLIREIQNVPIVYLVDYGSQATIRRVGATGPFGYVFRPFDEKQIFAAIETALIRHHMEGKLEQSRQWLNTTLTSIGDGVIATDEQGLVRFINPSAMEQIGVRHTEAIGRLLPEVFAFVNEESRQPIPLLDLDGQPLQASGNRGFAGLLVPCSGDPFPVEAKLTSITDGKGGVYGMVLIFRNVTQQRQALQEITRQANRAQALLQVASQLNSQLELKIVLNMICEIANQAVNAGGTAVVLYDRQQDVFRDMAAVGQEEDFKTYQDTVLEVPKEVLHSLLSRTHPVEVIQDVEAIPSLPYFDIFAELGIKSLAIAALFRGDELIGALISAFSGIPRALHEDEITLLRGLADQASSAIENAELFEQVRAGRERHRRLAKSLVDIQEAERRRIAAELHDHFGQLLTGLQFMLETVKSQADERLKPGLDDIQASVGDVIEQVREMSLNLRPGMLDDLGLVPTLRWHFERFTRQTGIHINFHSDEVLTRLPADVETAAYRIVQEALTNVARHAGVKSVFVGVAIQREKLWVEVVDHGRGFEATTVSEKLSSGLDGMRERAELAGGYLLLRSVLGQGTQVIAALPLQESRLERRKYVRKSSAD